MKYYIDYGTGAGNKWVEGTLQDAMKQADNGATYTKETYGVYLYNEALEEYTPVAVRTWYGTQYNADDESLYAEEPITFGNFGFYGDWQTEF